MSRPRWDVNRASRLALGWLAAVRAHNSNDLDSGERTKNPAAASWREMWRISQHPRRCRWFFLSRCGMILSEVDARDWTVPQRLIPVLNASGVLARKFGRLFGSILSEQDAPNRPSNPALCESGIHHRSGDDTLVALSAAAI